MTHNNGEHLKNISNKMNDSDIAWNGVDYLKIYFDYLLCYKVDPSQANNSYKIGALVTAAIKKAKTGIYLNHVIHLLERQSEIEITPHIVRHISIGLFKKTCPQKQLVELFSIPERTERATKESLELANKIIEANKDDAERLISETKVSIHEVHKKFKADWIELRSKYIEHITSK